MTDEERARDWLFENTEGDDAVWIEMMAAKLAAEFACIRREAMEQAAAVADQCMSEGTTRDVYAKRIRALAIAPSPVATPAETESQS